MIPPVDRGVPDPYSMGKLFAYPHLSSSLRVVPAACGMGTSPGGCHCILPSV